MRIVTSLTLAFLVASAGTSAVAQTPSEPAKKDTPAQATTPATPSATPSPPASTTAKDGDKIPRASTQVDQPRHIHRVRSVRRGKVKRRRYGGWRRVWVYRAHDRHRDRHYHVVWRKFGGYFASPRGSLGPIRHGRGCNCGHAYGHGYGQWHY